MAVFGQFILNGLLAIRVNGIASGKIQRGNLKEKEFV